MRKNDMIKFLEGIKGNPEIVIYRDSVGDWFSLAEPYEYKLSRLTRESYVRQINAERSRDQLPELTDEEIKEVKLEEWEINRSEKREKIWSHNFKNVVVLQSKPRGISTFDRFGGLDY